MFYYFLYKDRSFFSILSNYQLLRIMNVFFFFESINFIEMPLAVFGGGPPGPLLNSIEIKLYRYFCSVLQILPDNWLWVMNYY